CAPATETHPGCRSSRAQYVTAADRKKLHKHSLTRHCLVPADHSLCQQPRPGIYPSCTLRIALGRTATVADFMRECHQFAAGPRYCSAARNGNARRARSKPLATHTAVGYRKLHTQRNRGSAWVCNRRRNHHWFSTHVQERSTSGCFRNAEPDDTRLTCRPHVDFRRGRRRVASVAGRA